MTATLIREGREVKEKGAWIYQEMILQICMNYTSIPDVRTMDLDEIEFFYDGLKSILKETTKPTK